jgi:hypothetical protein
MSTAGVTQGALRKSYHSVNRVIPKVRQHGGLTNLCYQGVERVRNGSLLLMIEPLVV